MRAIWTGAIGFGLVNIPVKMYSATQGSELDLDMLDKSDQARIRFMRVNENSGKEVPYKNIVKAYNLDGQYVILEDEDFKQASPEQTKTIAIEDFVDQSEIDPVYFESFYFLEPEKSGVRPYALLREALKKSKKVGVATYVLRTKESLGIVRPYENGLILNKIRFESEIREAEGLNFPSATIVKKAEMEMALALIDKFSGKFDLSSYRDTYSEKLMDAIKAKAKGTRPKKGRMKVVHKKNEDLIDQLKASMDVSKRKKKAG